MKGLVLVILLVFVSPVMAFAPDNCQNLFPSAGGSHRPYLAPIYVSTMPLSTTSYFSSIGYCAMYGKLNRDVNRESFIARSYENIKQEASQGQGEHLVVLARLSGCGNDEVIRFGAELQKNYGDLFRETVDPTRLAAKKFAAKIDRKIHSFCVL